MGLAAADTTNPHPLLRSGFFPGEKGRRVRRPALAFSSGLRDHRGDATTGQSRPIGTARNGGLEVMRIAWLRTLATLATVAFATHGPLGLPDARAQQPGPTKVRGKVVDAQGKPVAGAVVSPFWVRSSNSQGSAKGILAPTDAASTDRDGTFTTELRLYGRDGALLAMDRDRKLGGLATVRANATDQPVTITLGPLARVHGAFSCNDLKAAPKWTNVYIMTREGRARVAMNDSEEARFDLMLPAGAYEVYAYGSDVDSVRKAVAIEPGKAELDLGTIDLPATIIAKHTGKAPPAWHVTDARGVKKDVTLSDFRGKWVLLEFWGFW
jgi:hypothetical protein